MQRIVITTLLAAALALGSSFVLAGLTHEKIVDGYYIVSYELSTWTKGGVLDTQERVDRKLIEKTHKLCLKEDYGFLRFPMLQEVARNEALRAAWLEASEEMADESGYEKWVESYFNSETHSARRIVYFSSTTGDGLEKCVKK